MGILILMDVKRVKLTCRFLFLPSIHSVQTEYSICDASQPPPSLPHALSLSLSLSQPPLFLLQSVMSPLF